MQKKWHYPLINIVALSLLSGTTLADSPTKPYIATGYTVTKDYELTHLIAVTQTDGNTWSYPSLKT